MGERRNTLLAEHFHVAKGTKEDFLVFILVMNDVHASVNSSEGCQNATCTLM